MNKCEESHSSSQHSFIRLGSTLHSPHVKHTTSRAAGMLEAHDVNIHRTTEKALFSCFNEKRQQGRGEEWRVITSDESLTEAAEIQLG